MTAHVSDRLWPHVPTLKSPADALILLGLDRAAVERFDRTGEPVDAEAPIAADEVASTIGLSVSRTAAGLRTLEGLGLVEKVYRLGEARGPGKPPPVRVAYVPGSYAPSGLDPEEAG